MFRLAPLLHRMDIARAVNPSARQANLNCQPNVFPPRQYIWVANQARIALYANPVGLHGVDKQHANFWVVGNIAHGKPHAIAVKTREKQGGFVPGIRPGPKTAEYLDYVIVRVLVVGSLYLAAVCLLPEFLRAQMNVPFYFGGTGVLITVSVTLDTVAQLQSHLLAYQYEGLIEKSRLGRKNKRQSRFRR